MADISALPIVISALTGGAAGAIITAIATSHRSRRDLALKFLDKYLEMFDEIAEAKTFLEDPERLASSANRNKVANVASWFEFVACCYLNGLADCDVLKSLGLPAIGQRLFERMRQAEKIQADGTTVRAFSDDRLAQLPHLRRLAAGAQPNCPC